MKKNIRTLFITILFAIFFILQFKNLLMRRFVLSPDSKSYISAAAHLLRGEGFYITSHYGIEVPKMAYIDWPPLYPCMIAILGFLGLNLIDAAGLISAFFFAALIFPLYGIINNIIDNIPFSIISSALIAYSWPFIEISEHAWTETPFLFFSYMALFCFMNFNEEKDCYFKKNFFLGTLFVTLSCLTRWTGLLLVSYGVFTILLKRYISVDKKIRNLLFFVFITCLPLFLWCLRSVYIMDSWRYIFGEKEIINSWWNSGSNFLLTLKVIFQDLFTLKLFFIGRFLKDNGLLNVIKLFLECFGLLFCLFFSFKKSFLFQTRILYMYIILYLLFIITISFATPLDAISTRYTVPMYPSLMILIFVLLYESIKRFAISSKMMKFTIVVFWLFSICFIYTQNWIYMPWITLIR